MNSCYTSPMSRFAKSTLIVAVFFGFEKVLGFVRQILTARQFGLSPALDAFNTADNLLICCLPHIRWGTGYCFHPSVK